MGCIMIYIWEKKAVNITLEGDGIPNQQTVRAILRGKLMVNQFKFRGTRFSDKPFSGILARHSKILYTWMVFNCHDQSYALRQSFRDVYKTMINISRNTCRLLGSRYDMMAVNLSDPLVLVVDCVPHLFIQFFSLFPVQDSSLHMVYIM